MKNFEELVKLEPPFVKILNPYAAGFQQGFKQERKRLQRNVELGVCIDKGWLKKPLIIPCDNNKLFMGGYTDGILNFRDKVRRVL